MKQNKKWIGMIMLCILLLAACGSPNPNPNTSPNPTGGNGSGSGSESESGNSSEENVPKLSTHTVTLYFSDDQLMETVRVEQDIEVEQPSELPQMVLNAWVEGPQDEAMQSLVPAEVTVQFIPTDDKSTATVSLSEEIFEANLGSTGELALVEQIVMLMEQFGYTSTQILVESEKVDTLLGHVLVDEPIQAKEPSEFKMIN